MSANVDDALDALRLVHGTYTRDTGFRLNWVVSDSDLDSDSEATGNPTLALNTIQDVIIPHGILTADQDVVYFTHASRSGIAITKRRSSSSDDVHTESLALISPTSFSGQAQTWHYISDLKTILATSTDVEMVRQAAKSWYSANVIKRGRSVRIIDSKTVTWEEQLADSAYHPLHNLPFFLRIFGPSFVTMYKYVLARMRVIVYVPSGGSVNIPSQENNNQGGDVSVSMKSSDCDDPDTLSIPVARFADASPLLARPCELASSLTHILSALCGGKDRPCALGFSGDDRSAATLLSQSEPGWIACTSNRQFILSHIQSLDLVVDLSPVFDVPSIVEKENVTIPNVPDGIKSPLLLLPSSPSSSHSLPATSTTTVGAFLQLRPTRFTLLDIQLWSDIQGVMKRIERAKQRSLRPEKRGRQRMNSQNGRMNGNGQGRPSISDSEDWDDGDFAVPGGWSLPNSNGVSAQIRAKSEEQQERAVSSYSSLSTTSQENIDTGSQPPQLPQKSTYTLDLITAFHRHVVSLSKSYATMTTTHGSNFSATASPTPLYLPPIEFDDLEKAFLEGGRRRRNSSLNGILTVSGLTSGSTSRTMSMVTSIATEESAATTSSTTVLFTEKRSSIQSERRSPTPTRLSNPASSFTQVASNHSTSHRSLSHSPSRISPNANTSSHAVVKAQSRSRSSSRDSSRTALAFLNAGIQYDHPNTSSVIHIDNSQPSKTKKPLSEVHVTLGSPSSPGPYSPPPYPYAFPSSYPRRPDTVTSMSSIPTSQFVTPESSPVLTARNSPVESGSREGTPVVSSVMKVNHEDDIEPLEMPQPVSSIPIPHVDVPSGPVNEKPEAKPENEMDKKDTEKEKRISKEDDKVKGGDNAEQSRNSVSFPSSIPTAQLINSNSSKKKSKFFWRRRSLSNDVLSNVPPSTSGHTAPASGRESPSGSKERKHASGVLPTESQLLEVEAELREQEARMLAPSPTPLALESPTLGPRKVKGWSVPADVFLGSKEREELAKNEPVNVDEAVSRVEAKDNDEKNLVLTPVEVLWEKTRAGSASPPKDADTVARSTSPTRTVPQNNPAGTQPSLPPHLFSPQPLPPGAAAPTPNVGPVITSIIDVLRGAIALHGDTPSPPLTNGHVPMDDAEEPLSPPPPLPAFSSPPARTPTPQSGQETPRGLPKIDEEEEEERSVNESTEDTDTRERGRISHESEKKHRPQAGHATDSGDADAEGADGDGETGSMTSSVTAAGSVSLGVITGAGLGQAATNGLGTDNAASSSSNIPPSPGFLSSTAASVSAPSLLLPPSPRPFASSPSPSVGLSVSPSPSPLPGASGTISPSSVSGPKSSSGNSTPASSPQKSKSPLKKVAAPKGHVASSSMSSPGPSTSLISNLTKSLSLSIRPRRLSLLSSNSNPNGKKPDVSESKDTTAATEEKSNNGVKKSDTTVKSRSAPSTMSSTASSSSSPRSLPTSNSTSPISPSSNTSSSSVSNGGGWIKRPRIRTRPVAASILSGSGEPVFNMVTLMSADEARSLGIEEWNGRNSGIGTLALAKEMRRAQEESMRRNGGDSSGGSAVTNKAATNGGAGTSPISRPGSALSSSKLAPAPKKGILRSRRASLTAFPPTEQNIAQSSAVPASSAAVGKQNQNTRSTPILKEKSIFIESPSEMSISTSKIPTPTPKSSAERKDEVVSVPPVPPTPEPMSPSSTVRSITPDSARRKLRKRRKSLIEPLGSTSVDTKPPLTVPA